MYTRYQGYTFEEALQHWADPAEHQRVGAELKLQRFRADRREAAARLAQVAHTMQNHLFEKLRRREILCSCSSSAERCGRAILPASTFDLPGITYDWFWDTLRADGYTFYSVEFFLPGDVPRNMLDLRQQFGLEPLPPLAGPSPQAKASVGKGDFRADSTYEHVVFRGREISLTKLQSLIVEALHQASLTKDPWVHQSELRERIGFDTQKISSLFRRMEDWRELISSDGRGHYRLNVAQLDTVDG